jgi:hypothetical protein
MAGSTAATELKVTSIRQQAKTASEAAGSPPAVFLF